MLKPQPMRVDDALSLLRAHEAELRAAGIERLSIFGSVARGDAVGSSDVDVVVWLSAAAREGGFAYIGRLDELNRPLEEILGCRVDVVTEPVRREALHLSIEREAALAF
jgi:hypothetical protein